MSVRCYTFDTVFHGEKQRDVLLLMDADFRGNELNCSPEMIQKAMKEYDIV